MRRIGILGGSAVAYHAAVKADGVDAGGTQAAHSTPLGDAVFDQAATHWVKRIQLWPAMTRVWQPRLATSALAGLLGKCLLFKLLAGGWQEGQVCRCAWSQNEMVTEACEFAVGAFSVKL